MTPEMFVKTYLPLCAELRRAARVLLGNDEDADDAVQEVMARMWVLREQTAQMENPRGYLFTMLRHHCLNLLKARREEVGIEVAEEHDGVEDAALQTEQHSERTLIEKIINTLPPKAARTMRLFHLAQLDIPEIAVLTGQNPESVRCLLSRSRQKVVATYRKLNSIQP